MGLIQDRYEVQSTMVARKIKQLENNEQELPIKVEMGTKWIKGLLDNHKDWFMKKIVDAMAKGWEA